MNKIVRIFIFIILILGPIVFYSSFNQNEQKRGIIPLRIKPIKSDSHKPKIALIFDDFGERIEDLKALYSLNFPVTISIIPGLKFSKNIAYIGYRCGFSIFIHLPLQPKQENNTRIIKYKFINNKLDKQKIDSLLRYYLNYIRVAVGVNNHMGSATTEDVKLMRYVLEIIKRKGLVFVDSRTSPNSVAYDLAKDMGLASGYNEGFLDSVDNFETIEKKLYSLVDKAKEKGKIIVIAHPKDNTFKVLEKNLPILQKEVEFITIKEYFEL